MHPNGDQYFSKSQHGRLYITDDNIFDPSELMKIQSCMDQMENNILNHDLRPLPENTMIVLLLRLSHACHYYMVNTKPDSQYIFWLDQYEINTRHYLGCSKFRSSSHLSMFSVILEIKTELLPGIFMDWQFWKHVALFPHVNNIHEDVWHQVADDMRYLIMGIYSFQSRCHTDRVLGKCMFTASVFPLGHDKLATMMGLVEGIRCKFDPTLESHR